MTAAPGERSLRTRDGIVLSARFDPYIRNSSDICGAGEPGLAFVVVHGFTGSWRRPGVRSVVEVLQQVGAVISFDLRGHGRSQGFASVGASEHLDVEAAVTWARTLGYLRVVPVGFSLGAALVVRHAGTLGGVDAVVAVSGPSRWNYRGTPAMRWVHRGLGTRLGRLVLARSFGTRVTPRGWEPVPRPPDAVAAAIAPTPLLVVHGDDDHYFPVEHARWLAEAAGPTATLWVEPGMGHAEAGAAAGLVRRIALWAQAASSTPPPGTDTPLSGSVRMRP